MPVVEVRRICTTKFDCNGVVTENPDPVNIRIYRYLQQLPIIHGIRFGKLRIDCGDGGTITEIQPAPSFRPDEFGGLCNCWTMVGCAV